MPEAWAAKAYPSLEPLAAWVDDLLARLAFIGDWAARGKPDVYWLSGFFFPQVRPIAAQSQSSDCSVQRFRFFFGSYSQMAALPRQSSPLGLPDRHAPELCAPLRPPHRHGQL